MGEVSRTVEGAEIFTLLASQQVIQPLFHRYQQKTQTPESEAKDSFQSTSICSSFRNHDSYTVRQRGPGDACTHH